MRPRSASGGISSMVKALRLFESARDQLMLRVTKIEEVYLALHPVSRVLCSLSLTLSR